MVELMNACDCFQVPFEVGTAGQHVPASSGKTEADMFADKWGIQAVEEGDGDGDESLLDDTRVRVTAAL